MLTASLSHPRASTPLPGQEARHPAALRPGQAAAAAAAAKGGFGPTQKQGPAVRGLNPPYSFATPILLPCPPALLDTAWLRGLAGWLQYAIDKPVEVHGESACSDLVSVSHLAHWVPVYCLVYGIHPECPPLHACCCAGACVHFLGITHDSPANLSSVSRAVDR